MRELAAGRKLPIDTINFQQQAGERLGCLRRGELT
jgi:hypothetical protein